MMAGSRTRPRRATRVAGTTIGGKEQANSPAGMTPLADWLQPLLDRVWAMAPREAWEALPTDLSANHDHYLYGAPKRSQ